MKSWKAAAAVLTVLAVSLVALAGEAAPPQRDTYVLYVAAESDDVVEKIAFGPGGFEHLKSIPVGVWPTETEGPHGLAVSPDGTYWYVTIAHGNPFGILFKYEAETDTYVSDVNLGLFPATMSVSPSTGLLFAVNFNLHGDHVPSTVSVVETDSMTEVAQIPTGVMPHGSRMNARGNRMYHVAMMSDELREIDAYKLRTSRVLPLSENAPSWHHYRETGNGLMQDHAMGGEATGGGQDGHGGNGSGQQDMADHHAMKPPIAKPTWATPVGATGRIYVAGNGNRTIYEVDEAEWQVARTFEETGAGPYNLDVSADGRILAVTYKGDQAVGFWDTGSGQELARRETRRPVPHGVVISPDGRYAFFSIEGIGGEPGSVEAYDLETFERVGHLDIAKQAGGIVLWKVR